MLTSCKTLASMLIVQAQCQSSKWSCRISANSLFPKWRDSSRFISMGSPSYHDWMVLLVLQHWKNIFIIIIIFIYSLLLSFSAGTFLCITIHQRRIFGWPRAEKINFKWNLGDSFLTLNIAVNILFLVPDNLYDHYSKNSNTCTYTAGSALSNG